MFDPLQRQEHVELDTITADEPWIGIDDMLSDDAGCMGGAGETIAFFARSDAHRRTTA